MMKLKTLLIINILLINVPIWAQINCAPSGARSNAMGGCYISLSDDWSNVANIAGSAYNNHINIGIDYKQNYCMQHHSFKSIAIQVPTKKIGCIITHYSHYGNTNYNEQLLNIGYALQVNPKIALGLTINYLHSGTSNHYYNNLNQLTFSAGLHIHPNHNLTIGAKIFNPIYKSHDSLHPQAIPTIIHIGISYLIIEKLIGAIELEKEIHAPIISHIGMEYACTNNIYARIGVSTHPNIFSCGIGLKGKRYHIDISIQQHQVLGISPQISANYKF